MVFNVLNSIKPPPPAKNTDFPGLTTSQITDYGNNWTNTSIPSVLTPNYAFLGCAVSGLGKYQAACVYNTKGIYVSNDYGSTWTLTSNVVDSYFGFYISYSGKYIFAMTYSSKLYKSTDFGETFSVAFTSSSPNYYFFSQDETYHGYISSTNILNISSDSGTSFSIPSSISSVSMVNAAFSQTGKYQIAISSSTIYVSSNFGTSFSIVRDALSGLNQCAMSLDGKYMYVNSSTSLRYSSDFGSSWNISSGVSATNGLMCDYTGKYVSVKTSTNIYISSNFGASFASKYSGTGIWNYKMSFDGKYLMIVNTGTTSVIVSKNYGETWATKTSGMTASPNNNNWLTPAISADGKYMLICSNMGTSGYSQYVYKSAG